MSKKYAFLLGTFIVLYVALIFVVPPDPTSLARFGIDALQLRLLSLTVALPLVVIWYLAFYGFDQIKKYSLKIIDSPDGRAFNTLANGLMVLALTLPVSSLLSTALRYFSSVYPDFTAATVITNRYIALCLAAVAFVMIYRGSKGLAALTTKKPVRSNYLWSGIAALIAAGLYTYVAFTNSSSTLPDPSTGRAVYYLPAWLIVTTIVIPYVCVWYLGLKSAAFILFYKRNVQGLVYEHALGNLAAGIGLVVCGSIVIQIFTALSSSLAGWGLQPLLALVYLLVIVIAAGYVLIAIGAKKLKKIEEV